jgi:hypothetical protein
MLVAAEEVQVVMRVVEVAAEAADIMVEVAAQDADILQVAEAEVRQLFWSAGR